MKILLFFSALVFLESAWADDQINICKRGVIGQKIARAVGAASCAKVSVEKMAELKVLDTAHSTVGIVPDYAFQGLSALEELSLRNSSIVTVGEHAFEGLPSLKKLNLWGNSFKDLPENIFNSLSSLEVLNFDYHYSVFPNQMFKGTPNLQDLELRVSIFPFESLKGLAALKKLKLEYYGSANSNEIPAQSFAGLSSLESLFLSGNKPMLLVPNSFEGLVSLEKLFLGNKIYQKFQYY